MSPPVYNQSKWMVCPADSWTWTNSAEPDPRFELIWDNAPGVRPSWVSSVPAATDPATMSEECVPSVAAAWVWVTFPKVCQPERPLSKLRSALLPPGTRTGAWLTTGSAIAKLSDTEALLPSVAVTVMLMNSSVTPGVPEKVRVAALKCSQSGSAAPPAWVAV